MWILRLEQLPQCVSVHPIWQEVSFLQQLTLSLIPQQQQRRRQSALSRPLRWCWTSHPVFKFIYVVRMKHKWPSIPDSIFNVSVWFVPYRVRPQHLQRLVVEMMTCIAFWIVTTSSVPHADRYIPTLLVPILMHPPLLLHHYHRTIMVHAIRADWD